MKTFWNWVSNHTTAVFMIIVMALFVTVSIAQFTLQKSNYDTAIKIIVKKTISTVEKQATDIESLNKEKTSLQKTVKRLEGRKMQEKDNVKNYILTYYKTVAPIIAEEMAIRIIEKSTEHNVPFVAVIAVTEVESHFNPFAISPKGARGPMQVMPRIWVKELQLSSKYDLHDIEIGIDSGVRILRRYLDATDNDMRKALYKYVGGNYPYIKQVYESMGKFIVFKSFTDIKVSEDEGKDEVAITDNDKTAVEIEKTLTTKTKPNILFTHIIKKGEMLGQLAAHYTGSIHNWSKIAEANSAIIPNKMPIGSVIIIPTNLLKTTKPL